MIQTMEQHRAKFALTQINTIKGKNNKGDEQEIRSYVNSFSAMIRMNGLGQALAFYTMKGNNHLVLVKIVESWLCNKNSPGYIFENSELLTAITQSDMQKYMAAQNESLELLEWLKKFALAFLEKESNEGEK